MTIVILATIKRQLFRMTTSLSKTLPSNNKGDITAFSAVPVHTATTTPQRQGFPLSNYILPTIFSKIKFPKKYFI
jgi:hypothetical protein